MFEFNRAVVLTPHASFINALSEHQEGDNKVVNLDLLLKQHQEYIRQLKLAGLDVLVLNPNPEYPDSPFVEDTHLILPEAIFVLKSGAKSRQGESPYVNKSLPQDRPHFKLETTMDGGDILVVDKKIFIGISSRTKKESILFVQKVLNDELKLNYQVIAVELPKGLHLKSSVTALDEKNYVVTKEISKLNIFQKYGEIIEVSEEEKLGANILPINDFVFIPPKHTKLKDDLIKRTTKKVVEVNTSEFNKKDGALTCISLRF